MVTVFSAVGGPAAATVGVMTGLAEWTLILAFVTPRRYRRGDEADLPVRSRWWVPVWTVFGRSPGAGFLVFVVFFALALISGGGGIGMGGMMAGSFLSSIAGVVVGSAIAQSFFAD